MEVAGVVGLGWMDWAICRQIWTVIMTDAVRTRWGFGDFTFQPLVPIVPLLAALVCCLGGLLFMGGWIESHFSGLPDQETVWRA